MGIVPKLNMQFHHLGVATRSIAREANIWSAIGYEQEGEVFSDVVQGVRGIFLVGPGPRLEILEPLRESKVLDGWLDRGIKIYHHAFEVRDINATLNNVMNMGAKIIVDPVHSVAFEGRLISFVMFPGMNLIEFIETPIAGAVNE